MADDEKKELADKVAEMDRQFGEFSRQDMENLKLEVVAELRKESFKKEILEDLEMRGFRASFWKTAQHPAILLILGFGLTTLLGSALTFLWQNKANATQEARSVQQRDFEQKQSSLQRLIQQKYALTEEVSKAVAETSTAAEDILDAWDRENKQAYPERLKYWQVEGSRKWRVAYKSLIPKLNSTFRDKRISLSFQEIIDHRIFIGNDIANLQGLYLQVGWNGMETNPEVKKFSKDALNHINKMADELRKLMDLMVDEIKIDEKPMTPPAQKTGLWNWVFS